MWLQREGPEGPEGPDAGPTTSHRVALGFRALVSPSELGHGDSHISELL